MSYKSIIALTFGHAGDSTALAFAARLAVTHKAHAEVFPYVPDPALDLISYGMLLGTNVDPATSLAILEDQKEQRASLEALCGHICNHADLVLGEGAGLPRMEIFAPAGRPEVALSHRLVLADLVVMSQESLAASVAARNAFGQVLLQIRTPLLIARGDPADLEGPVMIAWDGGAQAGRAVMHALPLLATASDTTVIQCREGLDWQAANPSFGPLLDYLRLHGVEGVLTETIAAGPEGQALVDAARRLRAGVLVAGAYGHTRFREAVLGGATRALLEDLQGPALLMAH